MISFWRDYQPIFKIFSFPWIYLWMWILSSPARSGQTIVSFNCSDNEAGDQRWQRADCALKLWQIQPVIIHRRNSIIPRPLKEWRNPCSWEEPDWLRRSGENANWRDGAFIVERSVISLPTVLTKKSMAVSHVLASSPTSCTLTKVQVMHRTDTELEALIDSGADESLMDWGLARKLGIGAELLERPVRARSLNDLEPFFYFSHQWTSSFAN